MSADLPYMPVFVDDTVAELAALDDAESGAYLRLMLGCWKEGGSLQHDPKRLARRAGTDPARWGAVWAVIERYFDVDADVIRHPRVTSEMSRAIEMQEARRRGAAATNAQRSAQRTLSEAGATRSAGRSTGRSRVGIPSPSPSPSPDPNPTPNLDLQGIGGSSEPAADGPVSKPPALTSPGLITFPCVGNGAKTWELTEEQASRWRELYPALDILEQARKALAWVEANQRKTAKGMPKFLVGWLNNATDRGRAGAAHANGFGQAKVPVQPFPEGPQRL